MSVIDRYLRELEEALADATPYARRVVYNQVKHGFAAKLAASPGLTPEDLQRLVDEAGPISQYVEQAQHVKPPEPPDTRTAQAKILAGVVLALAGISIALAWYPAIGLIGGGVVIIVSVYAMLRQMSYRSLLIVGVVLAVISVILSILVLMKVLTPLFS